MNAREDIKTAFDFAVRVALDQRVAADDLVTMLRSSYAEAEKLRAQARARKKDVALTNDRRGSR